LLVPYLYEAVRILHELLDSNPGVVTEVEFDMSQVLGYIRGGVLQPIECGQGSDLFRRILSDIVSGKITEKMLKKPTPATA
jgi:hypothetical protein